MFDRYVRKLGEENGYLSLFKNLSPLFHSADLSIVNLEGPITSSSSKTLLDSGQTTRSFSFTFATSTAQTIFKAGINIVSLANNHMDNFGEEGFKETEMWLDHSHVKYFGNPWNKAGTELVMTKNEIPIAFVGYHAFSSGFDRVLASVSNLSTQGDFVIVMPHWGREYISTSTDLERSQAQELIAAGAKAIIGSHSHVIAEHEFIDGVPVFYSLGNLIFDQYFSPEVMKGNLVELDLLKTASTTEIENIKTYETSLTSRKTVEVNLVPVILRRSDLRIPG